MPVISNQNLSAPTREHIQSTRFASQSLPESSSLKPHNNTTQRLPLLTAITPVLEMLMPSPIRLQPHENRRATLDFDLSAECTTSTLVWLLRSLPANINRGIGGITVVFIMLHLLHRFFLQHNLTARSEPLPAVFIDDASDFKRQADQLHLGVLAPFTPILKHLVPYSTLLNGVWFFHCITHNTEGPLHTAFRGSFKNIFVPEFLKVYNQHGKAIVQHHVEELISSLHAGNIIDLKQNCIELCRKITYLWFISANSGTGQKDKIESALFAALLNPKKVNPEKSGADNPLESNQNLTPQQKAVVEELMAGLQALPEQSIEAAQIKNTIGGGALYGIFNGFSPQSIIGLATGFLYPPLGFGAVWHSFNTIESPEKMNNINFRLGMLANVLDLKSESQSAGFCGFRALKQLTNTLQLANAHLPNTLIEKLHADFKKNMPQLPGLLGNTFAPSADEVTLFTSVLMVIASTFLTPVALSEALMSAHQNPDLRKKVVSWRDANPEDKASRQLMTTFDELLGDNIAFNALSRIEENGDAVLTKLTHNPQNNNGAHGFAQGGSHECLGRPLVTTIFADIIDVFFKQANEKNLALHFLPQTETLQPISRHDTREPAIFQWREIALSATQKRA